ncbi:Os12g0497544, partial [Oryza sativa Japonica Group]
MRQTKKWNRWGYLELVGCLLELDLELHHGGGPAGADDGGERHDGRHGLRGLGLAAPEVELLDHPAAAAVAPGGEQRRGVGGGVRVG